MFKYGWLGLFFGGVLLLVAGCHGGVPDDVPLLEPKMGFPDKFYSVQALSAEKAVVVGYAGKILMTEDGGLSWEVIESGTDKALYSLDFIDDKEGWICGQEGLVLHTVDGGRTWERQRSGTAMYMFALDFIDSQEGWAVGDRATYMHTKDGGKSWRLGKLAKREGISVEEALMANDPVLYDVQFVDRETGWIVGEFGKIYNTVDGGKSWVQQQEALLGEGGIFDVLDIPTFFGVSFVDKVNGIVTGLEGKVARTRNGGQTWKFEEFSLEVPLGDPLLKPLQFADTTAWAVGIAGEIVRQERPGAPWKRADLGMELLSWLRDIDFYDADNGWIVGGYGLILRTTDGGKSWLPSIG